MNATIQDWSHLKDFLALVRGGTLAKAGVILGVDASTVFRRINALEEALGSTLFERRGRGYALTPTGDSLVAYASRVEEQVLTLEREVGGRDQALTGTIVVTTTDTLALRLLGPHLAAFHQSYPSIYIDLSLNDRVFRLGRGEADVAIRPGPRPTELDVVPRELSPLSSGFYAAHSYIKDHGCPRRTTDLRKHRLIDLDQTLTHIPFAQVIRELGLENQVVFRSSNLMGQVMAVEQGLGIGLLPCFLMDRNERVRRLFSSQPEVESTLWLITHRDLRHLARVRAFVDFMTERLTAARDLLSGATSRSP